MSWFRRENPDATEQVGREAGERLRKIEPGLGERPLAHQQVELSELARSHGLTESELNNFEYGVWAGYTGKVYCEECQGYYLPHEH